MNNKITIAKKNTAKIKEFEEKEWKLANIERYGRVKIAGKKVYKLVSNDQKGNVLGMADLLIDNNIAHLDSLIVGSKHRREGVGKDLVLAVEKIAKQNKCTKITFETEENWVAPKFYKKMNYKITGKHKNHYFGTTCLIFTKYL
jgi:ribosomal protein S18 acetylase RimI-like enzyme